MIRPLRFLIDLLFPPKCCFCGKIVFTHRDDVCPACWDTLPELSGGERRLDAMQKWQPPAQRAAPGFDAGATQPLDGAATPSPTPALPDGMQLEAAVRCVSALRYEGGVRRGFLRYKFSGDYWLGEVFGEIMAGVIFEALDGEFDAVTWAPLSSRRRRKRGYDQAKILAETVAERLGFPLVPTLIKKRDTAANSSLTSAADRAPNVSGAYDVLPDAANLRLLLIDDILTTGATLSECARALIDGGAESVVCAVFAEADGT
ncbi:MAG: double zinc ribbon domain-containing protein [Oscillospiraceae bacterium]|nr:double zinc ribbon domain-containing protein [Oscillospiraceae bacterium]